MPCAIWGTSAESSDPSGDFVVFDSPRAGGAYRISGSAIAQLPTLDDLAKRLLTTWLCDQRNAGVEMPMVTTDILEFSKSRREKTVPQRLTSALLFVGKNIHKLGESVQIRPDEDETTQRFLAETESNEFGEGSELIDMLEKTGYIDGTFALGGYSEVQPTVSGWSELERLNYRQTDSSRAFVAMWFNDQMNDAYLNGIARALTASGYKPVRIDKKEHNNKIDDEIIAEIRRSRFVVADFTCEPEKVRGGVYYEAGFAQGLGLPVIWTCKESSFKDVHFDTRQYAHIVWKTPDDLFEQLKNRIGATIGDGPLPKQ